MDLLDAGREGSDEAATGPVLVRAEQQMRLVLAAGHERGKLLIHGRLRRVPIVDDDPSAPILRLRPDTNGQRRGSFDTDGVGSEMPAAEGGSRAEDAPDLAAAEVEAKGSARGIARIARRLVEGRAVEPGERLSVRNAQAQRREDDAEAVRVAGRDQRDQPFRGAAGQPANEATGLSAIGKRLQFHMAVARRLQRGQILRFRRRPAALQHLHAEPGRCAACAGDGSGRRGPSR